MNNCIFYGKINSIEKIEGDATCALIHLAIIKHRKGKDNQKIKEKTVLPFLVWDSAAATLLNFYKEGDFLLVNSTARNENGKIIFRINEFTGNENRE